MHTQQLILALWNTLASHFLQKLVEHFLQIHSWESSAHSFLKSVSFNPAQLGWNQKEHLSQQILSSQVFGNVLSQSLQYLSVHVGHLQGLYGFFLCNLIAYCSSFEHGQWYFFLHLSHPIESSGFWRGNLQEPHLGIQSSSDQFKNGDKGNWILIMRI